MKGEERLLINMCQSYFSKTALVVPEDIDLEQFFNLAKSHNQLGICQCVLNDNKELSAFGDDIIKKFADSFIDVLFLYELQTNALAQIKDIFGAKQLPFIAFKGAYLRNIYPIPESRSMGDIDLLVKEVDRQATRTLMASLGFEQISANKTVDEYARGNVLVEIHTRLTDEYDGEAFDDAFEHARFDSSYGVLDDSYHFAYLIAHLASHFKYKGAGIGLLLDLALMLRERDIDTSEVLLLLERVKLATFGKTVMSLCYELFGYGIKSEKVNDKVLSYFISYGVFGTRNNPQERRTADDTVSRLREFGAYDDKSDSRLKLKLKLAFPPYSSLRKASYMSFLNGRPYLLPFAWCYRFFYNIKHRSGHITESVRNINDEKTARLAKDELDFFEEIGLI